MARARNIKPGFYHNDTLAECSVWARFIFPGLWMMADREGRLEDRPARIKAALLPYDAQSADKLLSELHNRGFICRYAVSGSKYIQIINFHKHQNPHCKEPASTIPAPPAGCECHGQEPCETGASLVLEQDSHSSGPADSGFPLTDSISRKPVRAQDEVPEPTASFDVFWHAYPRKEKKPAALAAWKKLRPDPATCARILADVAARAAGSKWQENNGEFIPHPSSYLNARRWEDEGVRLPVVDKETESRREMTRRIAAERAAREQAANNKPTSSSDGSEDPF